MIVHRLEPREFMTLGPRIATLERGVSYPLGGDRFEIDHGRDYFAFFRRLRGGPRRVATDDDLRYYVAEQDGAISGVLAAVLRAIPEVNGAGSKLAWYLCDLKAARGFAHGRIATPLFRAFRADTSAITPSAYGVSMNASDGSNRLVRSIERAARHDRNTVTPLTLFSLDASAMARERESIERRLGPISFLSLAGIKDIVLASTGRPMPLLHVQHGPFAAAGARDPSEGSVHMLALPSDTPLVAELREHGLRESATATWIGFDEPGAEPWPAPDFVLTSDI